METFINANNTYASVYMVANKVMEYNDMNLPFVIVGHQEVVCECD